MASPYPSGFDNFPTDTSDASVSATDHHNDLADAINKIQVTLGLNPEVALAFTPFGPDLVTGDSQTFLAGLGDWVEVGGGTLTWEDIGQSHPLNPKAGAEGLRFSTSADADTVTLPIVGTFVAGQKYAVWFLVLLTGPGVWRFRLGDIDEGDFIEIYVRESASTLLRPVSFTWTPTADRSDVSVSAVYEGSDVGTLLDMFYCKVAEARDYLISSGFDLAGRYGGSLHDADEWLLAEFWRISLFAGAEITLDSKDELHILAPTVFMFNGVGLEEANLPALETATTEGEVIAGYNLIRTMLISLGLATDGD